MFILWSFTIHKLCEYAMIYLQSEKHLLNLVALYRNFVLISMMLMYNLNLSAAYNGQIHKK